MNFAFNNFQLDACCSKSQTCASGRQSNSSSLGGNNNTSIDIPHFIPNWNQNSNDFLYACKKGIMKKL